MRDARAKTLAFVQNLDDATLKAWPDAEFSPLCWHLGHLAFTEAHWALAVNGDASLSAPFARRYAQDGCAKSERAEGYDRAALFDYLARVREAVELRFASLEGEMSGAYLDWFLAAHEHQHRETLALVLSMVGGSEEPSECEPLEYQAPGTLACGGEVVLGTDSALAYDNERPPQRVHVPPFRVDAHPVTASAFARFITDGYRTRALWSEEGWAWREGANVEAPRDWRRRGEGWSRRGLHGRVSVRSREPVFGVSWFEADAYARWAGGRLPTEPEWELLAREHPEPPWCGDTDGPREGPREVQPVEVLGNVWEWTASLFAGRPDFQPFPYRGYSMPYFDGGHYVMRGGSFATDPAIATPTFRNWYIPATRQTFTGFRVCYT